MHLVQSGHEPINKGTNMKRRLLLVLLIVLVSIGGLVAGRRMSSKADRTSMTAVTITSQMTEFAPDGTSLGTRIVTRRQYADGRWKTRIDNLDGKPLESSGRIDPASLATVDEWIAHARAHGRRQDQILGYTVFIQSDPSGTEIWHCPELDTPLKEVIYHNGKASSLTEAVSVVVGQPE
jgi:hypothetical protein